MTINEIDYTVHHEGSDIILIPLMKDDHTLVLQDGYLQVRAEAYMQAKWIHQIDEIVADLICEYVEMNKEELIRVEA